LKIEENKIPILHISEIIAQSVCNFKLFVLTYIF